MIIKKESFYEEFLPNHCRIKMCALLSFSHQSSWQKVDQGQCNRSIDSLHAIALRGLSFHSRLMFFSIDDAEMMRFYHNTDVFLYHI